MPAWLAAAKAVLPYVSTILSATLPVFTDRKAQDRAPELIAQQIGELQHAARQNAELVKSLAEQMQKTVAALDQGAIELEQKIKRARMLAIGASVIAVIALVVAAVAIRS